MKASFAVFSVLFTFFGAFISEVSTGKATVCERKRQTISCGNGEIIEILDASYGRKTTSVCPHGSTNKDNALECHSGKSLSEVESTCNGKESCELYAHNSVFGDPCRGVHKYLEVQYMCTVKATVCERKRQAISCGEGEIIEILDASYGRKTTSVCPHGSTNKDNALECHSGKSLSEVESTCNGKESCELYAHNSVFGDPCRGVHKYLEVQYMCTDE